MRWAMMTHAKDSTFKGVQNATHCQTSPVACPSSPPDLSPHVLPLLVSSSYPPLSGFLPKKDGSHYFPDLIPLRVPAYDLQWWPLGGPASLHSMPSSLNQRRASNTAWPQTSFTFLIHKGSLQFHHVTPAILIRMSIILKIFKCTLAILYNVFCSFSAPPSPHNLLHLHSPYPQFHVP